MSFFIELYSYHLFGLSPLHLADDKADKSGVEDAEQANKLLERHGEKGLNSEADGGTICIVNEEATGVGYVGAKGEGDEGQNSAAEEVATVEISAEANAEVNKRADSEVDEVPSDVVDKEVNLENLVVHGKAKTVVDKREKNISDHDGNSGREQGANGAVEEKEHGWGDERVINYILLYLVHEFFNYCFTSW